MSKITKEEICKIAKLAKIDITDDKQEKYSKELSSILGYVEKLDSIKVDNINETAQVTGLKNVYQEDIATDKWKTSEDIEINRSELLKNAKAKRGEFIKVKQMLQ